LQFRNYYKSLDNTKLTDNFVQIREKIVIFFVSFKKIIYCLDLLVTLKKLYLLTPYTIVYGCVAKATL
jgi:hypothetical protein